MIPVQIDIAQIVADLNGWGWRDYKIEICCGLGSGYIAQVRCGNIRSPAYDKAARLFNFWEEEHAAQVSRGTLQTRVSEVTS